MELWQVILGLLLIVIGYMCQPWLAKLWQVLKSKTVSFLIFIGSLCEPKSEPEPEPKDNLQDYLNKLLALENKVLRTDISSYKEENAILKAEINYWKQAALTPKQELPRISVEVLSITTRENE